MGRRPELTLPHALPLGKILDNWALLSFLPSTGPSQLFLSRFLLWGFGLALTCAWKVLPSPSQSSHGPQKDTSSERPSLTALAHSHIPSVITVSMALTKGQLPEPEALLSRPPLCPQC